MFATITFVGCIAALPSLVSAAIAPSSSNENLNLVIFQDAVNATNRNPIIFPDTTLANANSGNTNLTAPDVWCSVVLGKNISPLACKNAIEKIPASTVPMTLGMRGRGRFDVTLPYIWPSDDGTCSVAVTPNGRFDPDTYSYSAIAADANTIARTCVGNAVPNTGGALNGVGLAGKLSVQINKETPFVICDAGPAPSYASCRSVLDTMPWSHNSLKFGPSGEPGVQVALPFLIPSADGQCVFQITSDGRVDSSIWSYFWVAIAQVDEMCIKRGLPGHAYNLGGDEALNISYIQLPRSLQVASA